MLFLLGIILMMVGSFLVLCTEKPVSGKSTVMVSLEPDSSTLKFEVSLDPMTQDLDENKEITVNFYSPDVLNGKEFYTDANGLLMQKRTLNHHDSYEVNIKEGLNVTANYYPVTSAIAIRDENTQMTVMNSHS